MTKYSKNPDWQAGKDILDFQVDKSWNPILKSDMVTKLLKTLAKQFDQELETFGEYVPFYPPRKDIFNAFNYCPLSELKVVVIGQDTYHGENQAHGLAFSVPHGVKIPPSLKNVYKALVNDPKVDFDKPDHGCLEKWAKQGILLLNCGLTVRESKASSHLKYWTPVTDEIIKQISGSQDRVIFVLWGGFAKNKRKFIDIEKHRILEYSHPSPLATIKFDNCRHFSEINEILSEWGHDSIDWRL
jgi:uracil-DNA glycosylase